MLLTVVHLGDMNNTARYNHSSKVSCEGNWALELRTLIRLLLANCGKKRLQTAPWYVHVDFLQFGIWVNRPSLEEQGKLRVVFPRDVQANEPEMPTIRREASFETDGVVVLVWLGFELRRDACTGDSLPKR